MLKDSITCMADYYKSKYIPVTKWILWHLHQYQNLLTVYMHVLLPTCMSPQQVIYLSTLSIHKRGKEF